MQSVLDTVHDGILIEAVERVVYVNAAYAELLAYRRTDELTARPVTDLIADCDVDRLLRFSRRRSAGKPVPSAYDFVALRRDATTIRLQASVSLAFCGGMPYITTIVRPSSTAEPGLAVPGPHDQLSPREGEVLAMILAGKRPKVIALELELAENTVATLRVRLFEKIGVADIRELFQYALRHRLIDWS
ncbi:MAG TPA: LuxR C-terminal-related transcriptional regulator [Thermoanaerobaculia bacterium]|jgi:PAS domain S-box-containing protein